MIQRLNIKPHMLTWAIIRAGYDLSDFVFNNPKVNDWIKGDQSPTVQQLKRFSTKVHIPFGYLFLQTPPSESLPIPFFRSENSTAQENVSLNVYDTIQLLLQRQDWLKEYLEANNFEELPFIGKYSGSNNVAAIVGDIRGVLGLDENWASVCDDWEDALKTLIETIEDRGIITVFNGVVENNTHRPIKVDECRGFVLVDKYAPFMFINNADSKSAQMFTIVHELAHVWTGCSAGFDFRKLQPAADVNEKLCDQVAAEFLVPKNLFNTVWNEKPQIKSTARYFKVSEIVIARRALDLGKISQAEFYAFYDDYKRQFKEKRGKTKSGGNFYATAKKRISSTFAHHVKMAVNSGELLYRDAYKLTSMKGDTL